MYAFTGQLDEAGQRQFGGINCGSWPQNQGEVAIYSFPGSANPNSPMMCMPGNL